MPNHVINEVIFRGVDDAQIGAIIAAACDTEGKVDFRVLIPEPLNIWRGNTGAEHEKVFRRTWYDWNRENWGTKWNAYSHQPTERSSDSLTLRFETAWSPPYPWLAALLNKFGLPFEHNWLDEGAERGRAGTFEVRPEWGAEWKEADAPDELHRHLHKLHWGVEEFEEDAA